MTNKSLEALEMIERELYLVLPKNIRDSLIQTIKQDLEHYHNALQNKYDYSKCLCYDELLVRCKYLEKENQELKQDVKDVLEDYKDAALRMFKYAEVIEIIKSKNVDIFFLRNNCEFDLEKYNYEIKNNTMQYCYEDCLSLTQQEYNLLKEVLK